MAKRIEGAVAAGGRILLAAALLAAVGGVRAQDPVQTVNSRSGQFSVHGPAERPAIPEPADSEYVRVTPASLALTCARIRAVFLEQLRANDRWEDRIHVVINPRLSRDADIVVAQNQFLDGWRYHVQVPVIISKEKLTRGVVRVLLQELANRGSSGRGAGVPLWLTEGMARHVLAATKIPLFPPVKSVSAVRFASAGGGEGDGDRLPRVSINLVENPDAGTFLFDTRRHQDSLASVKEALRRFEPLTFAQLDQPEDAWFSAEEWALFRECSHLCVTRMLELPGGPECLRRMLAVSRNYLNWQLAFLEGFDRHFITPLDIEKWWSLQIVNLRQPDLERRLTNLKALDRLDAILDSPVDVRGNDDETAREQFPLQVMIDLVEYSEQRKALVEIVLRLRRLRWQVSTDMIKLVDDYTLALETYVSRRDATGSAATTRNTSKANVGLVLRQTLDQLTSLDIIRADLRELERAAEEERQRLRRQRFR